MDKYFAKELNDTKETGIDNIPIPFNTEETSLTPEEEAVKDTGYIANDYSYKRWVMAQMFRMRNAYNDDYYKNHASRPITPNESYIKRLRTKGFLYQLNTTITMLENVGKMKDNNPEDYALESKFWNLSVAISILENYKDNIMKYYKGLPTKYFHKLPYKRVRGLKYDYKGQANCKYVDVFDFKRNTRILTEHADDMIQRIKAVPTLNNAIYCLKLFKNKYMISSVDGKFSVYNRSNNIPSYELLVNNKVFEEAYKGYGSYFTLQNMICHHGCLLEDCDTIDESMKKLNDFTDELSNDTFYKLFGLLNQTIIDNDFSFAYGTMR